MTAHPLAPSSAPLFFPVTPFDDADRVDTAGLRAHIENRLAWNPSAVVAASGAGEFHAMSQAEVAEVARIAVSVVAGRHPVLVGCGGPLGHARVVARAAEEAGAQGLLVMPPYLVEPMPGGMVAYVREVAASSRLPVIVYHRGQGVLSADDLRALVRDPLVAGVKDGVGDLALARRFVDIVRESGREFLLLNGMPTAEVHHAAYAELGIDRYSSAVFTMAPEIAMGFHSPSEPGMRQALLREFFEPFVRLRSEAPGLAVALVKTGLRLRGEDAGTPRPPLGDAEAMRGRLAELLERGAAIIRGDAR